MSTFALKKIISCTVFIMAVTVSATFNTGCSKKSSSTASATPAKDTLSSAAIVSSISSVVNSNTGLGPQMESNTSLYATQYWTCGTHYDTTISGNFSISGLTMNYSFTNADTVHCTGSTPSSVDFVMNGFSDASLPGTYVGEQFNYFMIMSGLASSSLNYTINSTCTATDTVKETSTTNTTAYVDLNYTSSNVLIPKATGIILSGTANISYSYTTSGGNKYNETATVTFLGNHMAKITLGNGYSTTVNW